MVLFSFMSFQSTSGLVRRLSQSTNYTRKEKIRCKLCLWVAWDAHVAHCEPAQASSEENGENGSRRLNGHENWELKKKKRNHRLFILSFQGRWLRQFPKNCSTELLQFWIYFTSKLYPTGARQCGLGRGIQIETWTELHVENMRVSAFGSRYTLTIRDRKI